MDEEEADVNFELLRTNSTDLPVMSDDFLSMLNTDCKASDIDEFNSWFQDNITSDSNIPSTDSILDTLGTVHDLDQLPQNQDAYTMQNDPSLTTHFYNSINDCPQINEAPQNFMCADSNYIAPFNLETPVTSPYDGEPGMTYNTVENNAKCEKEQTMKFNQNHPPELKNNERENDNDYYVKETYYKDESGNTFIEQEYIKKKDVPFTHGKYYYEYNYLQYK